jgi:hypothetical protein
MTGFIATAAPRHLTSWDDLDAVVADGYAGLTNDAVCYPPGFSRFTVNGGFFTFDDSGELASLTNLLSPDSLLDVPTWQVSVIETQLAARVWVITGSGGNAFHTNAVPTTFDPHAWVRAGYGQPPVYLTGAALSAWYASRDRARMGLRLTLIASNDWPTLRQAFASAATNTPSPHSLPPVAPADSNRLAFAGIESGTSHAAARLWLYTPTSQPVDLFTRASLLPATNRWTLLGTLEATAPFDRWDATPTAWMAFYHAARAGDGTDSDNDGLSDGRELLLFGTDPALVDTDNDGLSDFDELYNHGTNPCKADSDGDGVGDRVETERNRDPGKISYPVAADALGFRILTPVRE